MRKRRKQMHCLFIKTDISLPQAILFQRFSYPTLHKFSLPAYRLDLGSLLILDFQQFPEKKKVKSNLKLNSHKTNKTHTKSEKY